jgi:gluconolactonase
MNRKYFVAYLIVFLVISSCQTKKTRQGNVLSEAEDRDFPFIQKVDTDLDDIIAPDTKVDIISKGYDWTEGPLWVDGVGLLFSDIPPNKVYKWTKVDSTELFLTPSGYTGEEPRGGEKGSNGLLLDADGNLVLCQHGDRRIARMQSDLDNPEPIFETIIGSYQGKKFNSPNDACYDSKGNLYFTDPPYGLEARMDDPLKELDFQGVYRYSSDGELKLLTRQMSRPNGIALSPDEEKLYVANSDPEKAIWMEFDIDKDGNIIDKKVFYDATDLVGQEPGLPDGLKVDEKGNIFASGPGGIWIFNAEARVLGKIKTGQATSNCAIGDNGKHLFITADMCLMKVALKND